MVDRTVTPSVGRKLSADKKLAGCEKGLTSYQIVTWEFLSWVGRGYTMSEKLSPEQRRSYHIRAI